MFRTRAKGATSPMPMTKLMILETRVSKPAMMKRLSMLKSVSSDGDYPVVALNTSIDPVTFKEARAGIPVTTQRRFDVYPDVSKGV